MESFTDIDAQTAIDAHDIFRKSNNFPVTLKFEDVVCKIRTQTAGGLFIKEKSEEKLILNGLSGIVEPGEMLALLGPSGSGKTTLLSVLGGRSGGKNYVEGNITYNNQPLSSTMRRKIGFVTQDDILYPHLTVKETLIFAALLVLPNSLTKEEKILQAETVLTHLGLTNCKNSIIGGRFVRGVSGGERKRVSIAQEMLVNPSLLFLDEPTSGLDSTTAERIVLILSQLANAGRTVILTIHQPSTRLYLIFNKVFLLSEGAPLFFGKRSDAVHYFSSLGYAPPAGMNPSDFLLELATGIYNSESDEDRYSTKQSLMLAYKNNLEAEVKDMVHQISESGERQARFQGRELERWSTTWYQQFIVLLQRGVKERKHDSFSILKIVEVLVLAIIAGLLWYKCDISRLQDQIGLLFFTAGFWGSFSLFPAISAFPQEKAILQKERNSAMYRLSAYFISRTVADMPTELVLPTIFLAITYWMAGFDHSFVKFMVTLCTLLLNVIVVQGLGFALGALLLNQEAANVLGSIMAVAFMLVSGFYAQNPPAFTSWTKYISSTFHTYRLFLNYQFDSKDTYPCAQGECSVADFPTIKQIGLGLDGQLMSALALVIMLIGYRLIAYFALMRIGASKKLI